MQRVTLVRKSPAHQTERNLHIKEVLYSLFLQLCSYLRP